MKKFYWILWGYYNSSGDFRMEEGVLYKKHPFERMKELRADSTREAYVTLLNWKEITEDEFLIATKQS